MIKINSKITFAAVILLLTSLWSLFDLGLLNLSKLSLGLGNIFKFFSELFPPKWGILPQLLSAMWETIQISYTGTILGFLMSLILGFLATKNLFTSAYCSLIRMTIGAFRTVPSILYGMIFVIAFGLGPSAGTLAVAFYTVGYLAKMYYEAFEGVDREVVEAIKSTGCNRLQLFRFAILPETANTCIGQLLFMFEYNIRASTIMGFVGAGGIGYYMMGYLQMLQYNHLLTALILTFVVVMVIDFCSLKVRTWLLKVH